MQSPEEIVLEWLTAYNSETHTGPSPIRLTERIRAYGDERAAEMKERAARVDVQKNIVGRSRDYQSGWFDGVEDMTAAIRRLT